MTANEIDQVKPVRFPTAWLTYKQRIRRDLDRAYASEEGEKFFTAEYLARLSSEAKQLDERLVKLLGLQLAVSGFLVVGFVGSDASISLFGVTLKQATGVKEILLLLYSLIAAATWTVTISRETILTVVERLVELSTTESLSSFGKIASPSAFGWKFYVPRAYEDWIFPTRANSITFFIFFVLVALLGVAVILFSFAITTFFILDIYRHPTLGFWSNMILAYVGLTALFGIFIIVRFYVPQPYRDQSSLLELQALQDADAGLFLRKRAEIFGSASKFRRYRWTSYAKLVLIRARDEFMSCKTKFLAKARWRRRSF